MQNTVFSSASESFCTAHIIHAGPVHELAEKNGKTGNSHYFRLTTTRGAAFCHFKSEEAARRSRGLLGAMLGAVKPNLFRAKGDCVDVASVVSFGRVKNLASNENESVFGFPVNLNAISDKSATVWLTYQTEESAQNVRKAFYASVMSQYETAKDKDGTLETVLSEESNAPGMEVELTEA
jgi:hypothetical protein